MENKKDEKTSDFLSFKSQEWAKLKTTTRSITSFQNQEEEAITKTILNCWEIQHIERFTHSFKIKWLQSNWSQQSDWVRKLWEMMWESDCLKFSQVEILKILLHDTKESASNRPAQARASDFQAKREPVSYILNKKQNACKQFTERLFIHLQKKKNVWN